MKKIFFSFILFGSAGALMAQQPTNRTTTPNGNNTTITNTQTNSGVNTTTTTTIPPAPTTTTPNATLADDPAMDNPNMTTTTARTTVSVSVPPSVQSSFTMDHPAASNVVWAQNGDWYTATYLENGRSTRVYYNSGAYYADKGESYRMSLPMLNGYVPEDMVAKATEMYGGSLYSISSSKGSEGQLIYHVTLLDNGQSRTEFINVDGSIVASPYRMEKEELMASSTVSEMEQQPARTTTETEVTTEATTTETNTNTEATMDNPITTDEPLNDSDSDKDAQSPESNSGMNNGTTTDNTIRRLNNGPAPVEGSEPEISADSPL
jgi:hypothetical protein